MYTTFRYLQFEGVLLGSIAGSGIPTLSILTGGILLGDTTGERRFARQRRPGDHFLILLFARPV
jgi:hypothetical protein